MPEINFTIDEQTGEMEMKVEGVQGPQCADVAKIITELGLQIDLKRRIALIS